MNHGLSSLKESNSLAVSAQKHAEFLHQHASLYDFATIGKTKNPHIEYDNSYTTINTPGARARTQ
jgi:hypothetical protein